MFGEEQENRERRIKNKFNSRRYISVSTLICTFEKFDKDAKDLCHVRP